MKFKSPKPDLLILLLVTVALILSACGFGLKFEVSFISDGELYAKVGTNGREIAMPKNPTKDGYVLTEPGQYEHHERGLVCF